MPVMTYQGFGSELLKFDSGFKWQDFDFIICDEMQNLVNYGKILEGDKGKDKHPSPYLINAESALREIARMGKTKIVALSATPEKIYEHFGNLCYEVPMDKSDIRRLETFHNIPYSGKVEEILDYIAAIPKPMTGILYTTQVADMKRYIEYANKIGMNLSSSVQSRNTQRSERQQRFPEPEVVILIRTAPRQPPRSGCLGRLSGKCYTGKSTGLVEACLIPIAVGGSSTAFSRRSVKTGGNRNVSPDFVSCVS